LRKYQENLDLAYRSKFKSFLWKVDLQLSIHILNLYLNWT